MDFMVKGLDCLSMLIEDTNLQFQLARIHHDLGQVALMYIKTIQDLGWTTQMRRGAPTLSALASRDRGVPIPCFLRT